MANQPVHLTPKARAFFSLAISEQNVAFAKSLLAFGAGDSHVPGGCAAWNRGADYVEYLVPALRAGTRYSTGHREPHNQTAFACAAHGAGQHRDYMVA